MEKFMYARIINITAQSETQLTMWQEMFKNIGSKNLTELGAIQITLTKISPNKAILMNMYKDKETAVKVFQNTKDKVSELSKLLKMEINEGEVVFSQNSLAHE